MRETLTRLMNENGGPHCREARISLSGSTIAMWLIRLGEVSPTPQDDPNRLAPNEHTLPLNERSWRVFADNPPPVNVKVLGYWGNGECHMGQLFEDGTWHRDMDANKWGCPVAWMHRPADFEVQGALDQNRTDLSLGKHPRPQDDLASSGQPPSDQPEDNPGWRERLEIRAAEPDLQWERFDEDNDTYVGACGVVVASDNLRAALNALSAKDAEIETGRDDLLAENLRAVTAEAKLAKAVEALEPFARHGRAAGAFAETVDGPIRLYTDTGYREVPIEDFRRAAAFLKSLGEKT